MDLAKPVDRITNKKEAAKDQCNLKQVALKQCFVAEFGHGADLAVDSLNCSAPPVHNLCKTADVLQHYQTHFHSESYLCFPNWHCCSH